jgi:hypothetical protein
MTNGKEVNAEFSKLMFQQVSKELEEVVGKEKARKLIKENMDVVPWRFTSRGETATLHWVADGEIIKDDLYQYKTCSSRAEAKYEAIAFLLHKLNPEGGY